MCSFWFCLKKQRLLSGEWFVLARAGSAGNEKPREAPGFPDKISHVRCFERM